MAEMLKFTVNWTGFVGAPGYTNLYVRDFSEGDVNQTMADSFTLRLDAFLDSFQAHIPQAVNYLIDPTLEVVEDTTGELLRFMTITPDTARVGAGTGNYAAPSGAVVNWYTNFVRNGRRMKGKSFIVPLVSTAYESNGTLGSSFLTAIRAAANTLVTAPGDGRLGVWGRPTTPGGTDGIWAFAETSSVPDMAAVLRSRRA
jgi:hypothetical protein